MSEIIRSPEELKTKGNERFAAGALDEAISFYTQVVICTQL